MQYQTYTQVLEIVTCMMTYTVRASRFKDNPKEVSSIATGLKSMAKDLQQLGNKTFNPTLWQEYCNNLHGNQPVDILSSELPHEMWKQFTQKMSNIVTSTTRLDENSDNPRMVSYIIVHELTPLLESCKELLDSEHDDSRGYGFIKHVKELFGKKKC